MSYTVRPISDRTWMGTMGRTRPVDRRGPRLAGHGLGDLARRDPREARCPPRPERERPHPLARARRGLAGPKARPMSPPEMSSTTHTKEKHMHTLATLIETHGIDVEDHLDRELTVPIHTGLQRQGDIIVIPDPKATATTEVPQGGCPVVRGESGGNTHAIVADGPVYCDVREASVTNLTLALLTVPEGSVAYLAHPEHAYSGIGPGSYTIHRQREQADELRMVQD